MNPGDRLPYIRLSIARPRRGEEKRLEELFRQLSDMAASMPGCLQSLVLKPHDDSGEIARISIYEGEEAAEAIANNPRFMSLRAEVHLASEPGHAERAFFSI